MGFENGPESNVEKKKLGEVYGKCLQVDGVQASWMGSESTPIEKMPEHAGTYSRNNEVISFVNQEGEVFITTGGEVSLSDLQDAGYQEGSFGVPFSNSEAFVSHPTMAAEWQEMLAKQKRFG